MSSLFKFLVITTILKPQYLMVDLTKTNSFLNINIHFFELKKTIDLNCDLNHTSTNFLFLFFFLKTQISNLPIFLIKAAQITHKPSSVAWRGVVWHAAAAAVWRRTELFGPEQWRHRAESDALHWVYSIV